MVTDESMLRTRQVLASPRRVELLDYLTQATAPVTVLQAAEALGLHPNTARLHLEQLVEVGLVEQVSERRAEPGRPRALYTATRRPPADEPRGRGEDDYRALATVLARGLAATDDPAAAALAAGEGWIEALAEHEWPARPTTPEVAAAELESLLDELGFAPETDLDHGTVMLRRCPFADVARTNPSVVCGVHLGMVRRTLERLDSPLRATSLEPFVTDAPLTCRITLTRVDPATPEEAIPLPVLGKKPVAPRPRSPRSRT
jgi:predicted ArsR family transcriptional regulator